MTGTIELPCDGCGQKAATEHIARRLQRLEWTTRYRPVHIHTLLLSDASPLGDEEFLYSPAGEFRGEAGVLLEAAGISPAGKSKEAVQVEFQRAGFFLTHILECPVETGKGTMEGLNILVKRQLPAVATRIRRSLKPKRVVLIASATEAVAEAVATLQLSCPLILDGGKPFLLGGVEAPRAALRLCETMAEQGN